MCSSVSCMRMPRHGFSLSADILSLSNVIPRHRYPIEEKIVTTQQEGDKKLFGETPSEIILIMS